MAGVKKYAAYGESNVSKIATTSIHGRNCMSMHATHREIQYTSMSIMFCFDKNKVRMKMNKIKISTHEEEREHKTSRGRIFNLNF